MQSLNSIQNAQGSAQFSHDAAGRLSQIKRANGASSHYSYDAAGRLAQIRHQKADGSTSIRYGYDALGRRISRTQETGGQKQETQWILDTARPYSEIVLERSRQNGGAWQETRYTHTPDGVGQLISEQRQGKTLHVYEDGQGSARLITDDSGQIIETLDFDAFGNEPDPDPASPTRHRYTGESYDSATGLYHLRARDYDPKTGRFISMDEHPGSQSIPLTLNKYLYGNADPVNHVDSSGNFTPVDVSIGQSVAIGLSFSVPCHATRALINIREGANLGTELQKAAVNIAANGLIGSAIPELEDMLLQLFRLDLVLMLLEGLQVPFGI